MSTRTLAMIVGLAVLTLGILVFAIDLLDGEAVVRGQRLTSASTSGRFWKHVASLLIAAPVVAFGWVIAISEVRSDRALRRPRYVPRYEDERFRRRG